MKKLMNEKVTKYISSITIPESTRIILTDLDDVLFDNKGNEKEKISKNLLKYLLLGYFGITRKLTKKSIVTIFEKEELNSKPVSQMILPIKNRTNKTNGSIIIMNYDNILDDSSMNFVNTLRHNIEFYYNNTDEGNIGKFENNPIYDSTYREDLKDLIEDSIKKLYVNTDYKNIEQLLYYKIDELKQDILKPNVKLLDEILTLLEQKKDYYGLYAIAVGVQFSKQTK